MMLVPQCNVNVRMVKLCWDRNSTCEHAMWTFALTLGGQVVFEQHLTQA